MSEEWRAAPRLDGYEVSSLGRMRSWRSNHGERRTPRIVGSVNAAGYVAHRTSEHAPTSSVHRLVCEAFNGPPPFDGAIVRHLNDVRNDNRPENLAWGNASQNTIDSIRNGRRPGPRKLTAPQAADIRQRYDRGESPLLLAREFGVRPCTIVHIGKRRTWKVL